jgi:hypothetical protein
VLFARSICCTILKSCVGMIHSWKSGCQLGGESGHLSDAPHTNMNHTYLESVFTMCFHITMFVLTIISVAALAYDPQPRYQHLQARIKARSWLYANENTKGPWHSTLVQRILMFSKFSFHLVIFLIENTVDDKSTIFVFKIACWSSILSEQKKNGLRQYISNPLRHSSLVFFTVEWSHRVTRIIIIPEIPFLFFYLFLLDKIFVKNLKI